jgi:hypothetical protein
MKARTSFPSSVQAGPLWLRVSAVVVVTLSLILFSGCARKKVLRITHSTSSIAPATSGATNMHRLFDQLSSGMTEQEVASVVASVFYQVETKTFLDKHPFRDLLPEVNARAVTEWRTSHVQPDGWPEVLFTIFADASKTNLVDAFWFKDGNLTPAVDGLFGRNVRAVKPGDSIEAIFRVLGKRNAEYFRGSDGKWHVKFIYWAHRGRIFVIEADAAEGRVVRAGDGTI